jgi:transcriptional regulator with XRE-family HTH domain
LRLRELRMNAHDVAACTGIDHSTISRFLSGETTNPTAETFVALLLWAAEPTTPDVEEGQGP